MDISAYLVLLHYLCVENPKKAFFFLEHFPDYTAFHQHQNEVLSHFSDQKKETVKTLIQQFSFDKIQEQLDKKGVSMLLWTSPSYPALLRQIPDPPLVLFYKGNVDLLDSPLLGVVGPRKPSDYGCQVTRHLVKGLCRQFGIVSGLAEGIDTVAHQTALEEGQPTIAVIGTSFEFIYPSSNKDLFEKITDNGLIISEYPLGTSVKQHHFPKRNRLISGISKGILIAEAGEKSGSLITAKCALEQNRDVFAVPSPIFSQHSLGVNRLIQDGAKLVKSVDDIFAEFYEFEHHQASLFEEGEENALDSKKPAIESNLIKPDPTDLDASALELYRCLDSTPQDLDQLSVKSGLMIHQVLQYLSVLELKNYAKEVPGQLYVRG